MTFSYQAQPLTREIDAVRVEIGDTLEREHLVEDEEIEYALSKEGSVLRAAARICEQLAARFAPKDSIRVSTVAASKLTVTSKYLTLAGILRRKAVSAGSFIMPSLSQADKDANALDGDIPQPSFYRGIHKNTSGDEEDSLSGL